MDLDSGATQMLLEIKVLYKVAKQKVKHNTKNNLKVISLH